MLEALQLNPASTSWCEAQVYIVCNHLTGIPQYTGLETHPICLRAPAFWGCCARLNDRHEGSPAQQKPAGVQAIRASEAYLTQCMSPKIHAGRAVVPPQQGLQQRAAQR